MIFIDQYNLKEINFSSPVSDWKRFEANAIFALNVLYVPHNNKELRHTFISKRNSTHENQIIILMITDGENGIIFQ